MIWITLVVILFRSIETIYMSTILFGTYFMYNIMNWSELGTQ